MRNFRELNVWKDGRILVKEVYTLTKLLPDSERFGLISQANRSVISIPANIAEGCAKYSEKDFVRFLQISLGSAYELETYLILCQDLGLLSPDAADCVLEKIQRLQQKIVSFIKHIKSKH